jgi:hypothetical protein
MFNLEGFVHADAITRAQAEVRALSERVSYTHRRLHNVYFLDRVDGISDDHPALTRFETCNHTLCDDQLVGTLVHEIYEWQPMVRFLADVMDVPELHLMKDPLARANVMEYRPGEALNWHFDRCRYTTTLLIQPAEEGGEFEYSTNLRSAADPNYEGVGRVLRGDGGPVRTAVETPVLPIRVGRTGRRLRQLSDHPGVPIHDHHLHHAVGLLHHPRGDAAQSVVPQMPVHAAAPSGGVLVPGGARPHRHQRRRQR